jgi:hypothetical protein
MQSFYPAILCYWLASVKINKKKTAGYPNNADQEAPVLEI